MFCRSLFVLLTIVLSLLLRLTDSDYLFGIFKLFLYVNVLCNSLYDYVFSMIFVLLRCLCYFYDYACYNILRNAFFLTVFYNILNYYVLYEIFMTMFSSSVL